MLNPTVDSETAPTTQTPLYVNVEDTKSIDSPSSYIQMTKQELCKKRTETSNNYINTATIPTSRNVAETSFSNPRYYLSFFNGNK